MAPLHDHGFALALTPAINSSRYAYRLFRVGFQGQEGMDKDPCTNYANRQNHNSQITFSKLVDKSSKKIRTAT